MSTYKPPDVRNVIAVPAARVAAQARVVEAARELFAGNFIDAGTHIPSTRPPNADDQWTLELADRVKILRAALAELDKVI